MLNELYSGRQATAGKFDQVLFVGTSSGLSINAGVAHEWSACPCRKTKEQGNKPCVQEMPLLACELLIRLFKI
jgi:hypothetical protein